MENSSRMKLLPENELKRELKKFYPQFLSNKKHKNPSKDIYDKYFDSYLVGDKLAIPDIDDDESDEDYNKRIDDTYYNPLKIDLLKELSGH